MILIAFLCARIPSSPDKFKRRIKNRTFQTPLDGGFESVLNIVFSFETYFESKSVQFKWGN